MSWRIRVVTARHYAEISLRHDTIDNPGYVKFAFDNIASNDKNLVFNYQGSKANESCKNKKTNFRSFLVMLIIYNKPSVDYSNLPLKYTFWTRVVDTHLVGRCVLYSYRFLDPLI